MQINAKCTSHDNTQIMQPCSPLRPLQVLEMLEKGYEEPHKLAMAVVCSFFRINLLLQFVDCVSVYPLYRPMAHAACSGVQNGINALKQYRL